MKIFKYFTVAIALGVLSTAAAQEPTGTTPAGPRKGRVVTPEPPRGNLDPTTANAQQRPTRLERNELTPEVLDKIRTFRTEADKYVRQQEELRKQIIGAMTESERERIREMMRAVRERWLERARIIREQTKDRLPELMDQLPNRRELLRDAAREKANTIRDGAAGHNRRGGE